MSSQQNTWALLVVTSCIYSQLHIFIVWYVYTTTHISEQTVRNIKRQLSSNPKKKVSRSSRMALDLNYTRRTTTFLLALRPLYLHQNLPCDPIAGAEFPFVQCQAPFWCLGAFEDTQVSSAKAPYNCKFSDQIIIDHGLTTTSSVMIIHLRAISLSMATCLCFAYIKSRLCRPWLSFGVNVHVSDAGP